MAAPPHACGGGGAALGGSHRQLRRRRPWLFHAPHRPRPLHLAGTASGSNAGQGAPAPSPSPRPQADRSRACSDGDGGDGSAAPRLVASRRCEQGVQGVRGYRALRMRALSCGRHGDLQAPAPVASWPCGGPCLASEKRLALLEARRSSHASAAAQIASPWRATADQPTARVTAAAAARGHGTHACASCPPCRFAPAHPCVPRFLLGASRATSRQLAADRAAVSSALPACLHRLQACVAKCRACARCNVVSFSRQHHDCSWYASCHPDAASPDALDEEQLGFVDSGWDYVTVRARAVPRRAVTRFRRDYVGAVSAVV